MAQCAALAEGAPFLRPYKKDARRPLAVPSSIVSLANGRCVLAAVTRCASGRAVMVATRARARRDVRSEPRSEAREIRGLYAGSALRRAWVSSVRELLGRVGVERSSGRRGRRLRRAAQVGIRRSERASSGDRCAWPPPCAGRPPACRSRPLTAHLNPPTTLPVTLPLPPQKTSAHHVRPASAVCSCSSSASWPWS